MKEQGSIFGSMSCPFRGSISFENPISCLRLQKDVGCYLQRHARGLRTNLCTEKKTDIQTERRKKKEKQESKQTTKKERTTESKKRKEGRGREGKGREGKGRKKERKKKQKKRKIERSREGNKSKRETLYTHTCLLRNILSNY
jgi:hypothetical protein